MKEVVHYVELDNTVSEDDGSILFPYALRIALTQQSIDRLARARMAYQATRDLCHDLMVWKMELEWGSQHLEYLIDTTAGAVPWKGEFSALRMQVREGCVEFVANVPHTDVIMRSCSLMWERLDEEIRQWRALSMGQSLEDAMPGEEAPAPRKSSGMAPL